MGGHIASVLNAAERPEAEPSAARPHLAPAPELGEDLWPRLAEVRPEGEAEAASETRDGARSTFL